LVIGSDEAGELQPGASVGRPQHLVVTRRDDPTGVPDIVIDDRIGDRAVRGQR
jgi:hypothetical protein